MEIRLEKATESDAEEIYDIQVKAFLPLLERYQDFETNPANETIDRVITRINNPQGGFYKIMIENAIVGAICVVYKEVRRDFWISPMFIHPEYQGKGLAQRSIELIRELFPEATTWELATILEEERNCYLYEKMGFIKTGVHKKLNDRTTLVFYKQVCFS
ncbi:GNAT family N-acetyltransferase [Paenibacillus sp. TRM 82003]|nr:GNAT family N-acetyltransferase [Paenibacillus sp. TRM 82003]